MELPFITLDGTIGQYLRTILHREAFLIVTGYSTTIMECDECYFQARVMLQRVHTKLGIDLPMEQQ